MKIVVLVSQFNSAITDNLLAGAQHFFATEVSERKPEIVVEKIPGAFELPQAASIYLANSAIQPDAIVALGAVVRGETPHFDYVCSAAAWGLTELATKHALPIGFGLITADTLQQAEARAALDYMHNSSTSKASQLKSSNKGFEAAEAVWQMLQFARRV